MGLHRGLGVPGWRGSAGRALPVAPEAAALLHGGGGGARPGSLRGNAAEPRDEEEEEPSGREGGEARPNKAVVWGAGRRAALCWGWGARGRGGVPQECQ